jgi:hypothetical protein
MKLYQGFRALQVMLGRLRIIVESLKILMGKGFSASLPLKKANLVPRRPRQIA